MAMVTGIGRILRCNAAWRVLTAKGDTVNYQCPCLRLTRGITTKLFVGGLSFYTTEDALRMKFSEFGEVVDVKIIMDRVSQRSKGFGFIWYASETDAEKAKSEMSGKRKNPNEFNTGEIIGNELLLRCGCLRAMNRGNL